MTIWELLIIISNNVALVAPRKLTPVLYAIDCIVFLVLLAYDISFSYIWQYCSDLSHHHCISPQLWINIKLCFIHFCHSVDVTYCYILIFVIRLYFRLYILISFCVLNFIHSCGLFYRRSTL